ncbi:MAG: carbohydrate ABC transporter permease [Acidimicrobiales bacterium]
METEARRRSVRWGLISRYALLTVCAVIVLFPIYSAVMVASKPLRALGDLGVLVPDGFDSDGFTDGFRSARLGRFLVNSVIVATAITAAQVMTSVMAGYALALLRFPGRRVVLWVFLATLMVPVEVTIVANFETIQRLGWIDSYQALVVPFAAFAVGTFLLRQAFLGIPGDLRDAARMDGHGHLSFLWRVAVPMARPSIAALSVFSFLLAWNQYLWPLLVTNDDDFRTVQIGLKALSSDAGSQLNVVMGATVMASLPIFLLLVVFERQLVRGLTAGSIKG